MTTECNAAQLREANQDASAGSVDVLARLVQQIRGRWPEVRIVLRADSGFARDTIMTWCEQHQVFCVLGLAKNPRLLSKIGNELVSAFACHADETRSTMARNALAPSAQCVPPKGIIRETDPRRARLQVLLGKE